MRLAIIETGTPPAPLDERYPSYPQMMERMLAPLSGRFSFATTGVEDGALPRPADFDGLLITGSPAGVYEEHSWIEPLKDLIRAAALARRPQVGVCFGHQIMAAAFGGEVVKSDKGWGVGLHAYRVDGGAEWMTPAASSIACAVSHQDQVANAPAGARVLAGSDFCPNGVLDYAQGPAISFQMHPEFETEYAAALYRLRRNRMGEAKVDDALASLRGRSDRGLMARWIANFYLQSD
ncbi:MAG: hypothetical protein R3C60_10940 [Parvularculaceae bacterium]